MKKILFSELKENKTYLMINPNKDFVCSQNDRKPFLVIGEKKNEQGKIIKTIQFQGDALSRQIIDFPEVEYIESK